MRQSSTAQPPSPTKLLHPVLHNALANLDFQLEEELARYRRQRTTSGRTRRSASRKPATKTLDLISISATTPATTSPAQPPQSHPSVSEAPVDHPAVPTPHNGHESAPTQPPAAIPTAPDKQIDSPLAIATSPPTASLVPESHPGAAELPSPPGAPQETLTHSEDELDDYLESSEELLKSLAEEEAKVQAERGFMKNLLTPLGFGSMLLLLLSSAMFGYIVMNPSSFSRWMASRNATTPASPSSPSANTPIPTHPEAGNLPQPNLAAREFKDLNLDTLGTLKANSSASKLPRPPASSATGKPPVTSTNLGASGRLSTATTSPIQRPVIPSAPILEARPAAPAVEAAPPQPDPVSSYTPPAPAPQIREEAPPPPERSYVPPAEPPQAAPPPVASSEPVPPSPAVSAQAYPYKLVTPYQGDPSLDNAQKAEPGAFLTENGSKIQVGAFSDSSAAAARAEELRQQGISVEVQKR